MPRSERSAGVVVFRQEASAPGGRAYLLLNYGRHWDYPKGHVEKDENDTTAALRELKEETGIDDVALLPDFAHEIIYFFRDKNKGLTRKTVVFFAGQTSSVDVKLSHEHVGSDFLPFDEALRRLTFATAKQVLKEAHAFLDRNSC